MFFISKKLVFRSSQCDAIHIHAMYSHAFILLMYGQYHVVTRYIDNACKGRHYTQMKNWHLWKFQNRRISTFIEITINVENKTDEFQMFLNINTFAH